jgi:hypothetical protein
VADGLRGNAADFERLLAHPRAADRPNDEQWSAVEYACHVRDVHELAVIRLGRMLGEDDPHFANWDQDDTAIERRYDEQSAEPVAAELRTAAEQTALLLESVRDDQWQRGGLRGDGARFTVASFALYVWHDPVHHVWDVEQGYATFT